MSKNPRACRGFFDDYDYPVPKNARRRNCNTAEENGLFMKFNPFEHGGTISTIGICLLTLVISYLITKGLKFIPYVNKLI